MARGSMRKTLIVVAVVAFVITILIDSSMGCLQTNDINPDQQWVCFRQAQSMYHTRNICCNGLSCRCDENGTFTTNPRYGRDCKCEMYNAFNDYYAQSIQQQQQPQQQQQQQPDIDERGNWIWS